MSKYKDQYRCKRPDKCYCSYCEDKKIKNNNQEESEKNNEYLRNLCGNIRLNHDTIQSYEYLEDSQYDEPQFYGNPEKIEEALSLSYIDVNNKDVNKKTLLMLASQIGHIKAVILLLSNGANVHNKDNNGNNALYYASKNNHCDVVDVLLLNRAKIDDINDHGKNSLHIAAEKNNADVVNILLLNGASIYDTDYYSFNTPQEFASENNNQEIAELLKHWPILMVIIVLKKLIVYHELDATTLIDIYEYL